MLVSDTSSTRDYLAVVMEAWLSGVYRPKCERVSSVMGRVQWCELRGIPKLSSLCSEESYCIMAAM